jgi:hypothetical protein
MAVALAGCGKSAGSTAPSVTEPLAVHDAQPTGSAAAVPGKKATCPSADKVVLLEPLYQTSEEGSPPIGWNLPLAAAPAPDGATTGPLSLEDAKAFGVVSVPKTVWIYRGGQPVCRGTVSGLTRNLDDAPGSMSIDALVDGCAPPERDDPGPWFGLAVDAEPKGCELSSATVIAERVGEADGVDWVRPTKETPIPTAIASLLPKPKETCDAPACEPLWEVRAAEVASKPLAYEATLTWAHPDETMNLCLTAHEDDHALFAVGKTGPKKLVEAGTWQHLAGVFYDATGPRAMVTTAQGTYTVRAFGPDGAAGAAVTRTWYVPSDEAVPTWSLAQYCTGE